MVFSEMDDLFNDPQPCCTGSSDPVKQPTKISNMCPRFKSISVKSIHAGHMSLCVRSHTGKLIVFGNMKVCFFFFSIRMELDGGLFYGLTIRQTNPEELWRIL